MTAGIIIRVDRYFYEGLAALLSSIRQWCPEIPILILDCGLTRKQHQLVCNSNLATIIRPDLSTFSVAAEMAHYYTPAIYGLLPCDNHFFPTTINLDADLIVLGKLDDLIAPDWEQYPRFAAVPDIPHLDLGFQIGNNPVVRATIRAMFPPLNMNTLAFNGGVFVFDSHYYLDNMKPTIKQLLPYHNRLWGNEMAMLNIAANCAHPEQPFRVLKPVYNARPTYRRAPELPPTVLTNRTRLDREPPHLECAFGPVRILHFIGKAKPWHADYKCDDSQLAWAHYRHNARKDFGL